ncbi:MAG TPA: glycerol-3-phosphate acyltransferase [Acidimicrobiales bacterium]|nr:glycerol-3-phosphate acyltransferase [Acidimicrobiales bacterium]
MTRKSRRRARPSPRPRNLSPASVLGISYLLGSVPVANLASKALKGVDLRDVGNGTVSGTGLYDVAGFTPLAVAGCLELAKGAAGPLIAGRNRPVLRAACAGAAVTGHNWSPFLGFSGGRGLSVAMGALLAFAPEGSALIGAGLGIGRLASETGLSSFAAVASLPLVMYRTRGRSGAAAGVFIAVPIVAKRLAGNGRPEKAAARVYLNRLLYDSDTHGVDFAAGSAAGQVDVREAGRWMMAEPHRQRHP